MNFRNISSWCIRNPVPSIVLFIALLLAGIISFSRMTVTNNPDIDFPGVTVGVSQPGAAPSEMEKQVTQKIEAAVRGVNGVDEIDSSSAKASATLSSSSPSERRRTVRSMTCATPSHRPAPTCPTESSSRKSNG